MSFASDYDQKARANESDSSVAGNVVMLPQDQAAGLTSLNSQASDVKPGLQKKQQRNNQRAKHPTKPVRPQREPGQSDPREEALQAKEQLEAVLASVGDGFWTVDHEWRLTYANDNIARMAETKKEKVLGKSIWEVFPDLVNTKLFSELQRAKAQRTQVQFEFFYPPNQRWFEHRVHPSTHGLSVITADITGRKQVERSLREKEERMRFNLEAAHVGTWEWNIQTSEVHWSENMESVHGQAPGSFGGTFEGFLSGVHPEDRERVMNTVQRTLNGSGKYAIEYRQLGADGGVKWMEGKGKVMLDDAGRPARMMGVCMDITERKQAELALRESESRLRQAQAAAQIGTWEWDPVRNINLLSPELHEIFGTELDDPNRAQKWAANVHADDWPKVQAEMDAAQTSGEMEFEYRYQHPQRGLRWFYCRGRRFTQDDSRMFGIVYDITERKRKEALLGFQANVLAEVRDVVLAIDGEQRVTYWNQAAKSLYGFGAAEVKGRKIQDVIHYRWIRPEDEEACGKSLGAHGFWQGEVIQTKKSGEEVWVETSVSVVKGAEPSGDIYLAIMRDITERKRAEEALHKAHAELEQRVQERTAELSRTIQALQIEAIERDQAENALRESEQRLHSIMDSSPSIIFIKDKAGRYLYGNPQFESLCKLTRDQVVGKTDREIFPPAQANAFTANDRKVLEAGIPLQFEEVAEQDDGIHTSLVTKFPLRDTYSNVYAVCGMVADITQRKRAEEALSESEQRLHSIMDSSPSIIFIKDIQGRYLYVNHQFQQQLPNVPREHMVGKTASELFPPGQTEAFTANDFKVLQTGTPLQFEETVTAKDGVRTGIATKFPLRDTKGKVYAICGIVTDITERKQAEEAVRESEARLRALVESMDDIAFEIDDQGRYINVWTANEKLLARPKQEMLGQRLETILDPEVASLLLRTFARVLEKGKAESVEYALNLTEGKRWFSGHVSPIRSEDGSYRTVCLLVREVTQRRQLEEALTESETRFRTTFRDLDVGVAVVGRGTDALLFNEAAFELLELKREQLAGRSAFDPQWKLIHEDGSPVSGNEHPSALAVATRKPVRNVVVGVYRPSFGDYRWLLCNAIPRLDAGGEVVEVICSFSDITIQKTAEQGLQASEARLRALVESMDDIAFEIDESGTYLNIWTAHEHLLPRPKEVMIGGRVGDFFGPDFARPFVGVFQRVLATGKPETVEYELGLKEGQRWFMGRVSPIRSEDRIYKSVCLLVRDITDRKLAEEAQSERALVAVLGLEIGASLNEASSLRTALQECAQVLVRQLGAAFARIWTLNEATNVLELEASAGIYTHLDGPHSRVPLGQLKIGLIAQERKPHISNDVLNDPQVNNQEWARQEGMASFAGYPMVVGDRVIGVIAAFSRKPFKLSALQAFSEAADRIAHFVERKQAQDSLRELSGRLLHVQDEERRRLARELHDSTAQSYAALSFNLAIALESMKPAELPRVAKTISESLALADQACREIRTFSYLLHPPLLDEAGLTQALRYFVGGFVERTNIKVDLEVSAEPGRLSRDMEMALFRVAQECLTNIHRHSKSPKAEIRLAQGKETVEMEVRDYGIGLPPSSYGTLQGGGRVTLGVGVRGMRERVRQLGGNLEVAPGNPGTIVRAVMPLSKPSK